MSRVIWPISKSSSIFQARLHLKVSIPCDTPFPNKTMIYIHGRFFHNLIQNLILFFNGNTPRVKIPGRHCTVAKFYTNTQSDNGCDTESCNRVSWVDFTSKMLLEWSANKYVSDHEMNDNVESERHWYSVHEPRILNWCHTMHANGKRWYRNGFVDFHTAYSAAIYGLTANQASTADAKFRLCIVHCIVLVLKILNSISCLVPLFSVLHADSKNGTQHISWPLTFLTKLEKLKIIYFFTLSKRSNAKICIRGKDYFVNCKQNPRARNISILYFWETWHGLVSWKQNIRQSNVKLVAMATYFFFFSYSWLQGDYLDPITRSYTAVRPNEQCITKESPVLQSTEHHLGVPRPTIHRTSFGSPRDFNQQDITWESPGLPYTGHHLGVPMPPIHRTSLGSHRDSNQQDIIWESRGLQSAGYHLGVPGPPSTGHHLGVPEPPIHRTSFDVQCMGSPGTLKWCLVYGRPWDSQVMSRWLKSRWLPSDVLCMGGTGTPTWCHVDWRPGDSQVISCGLESPGLPSDILMIGVPGTPKWCPVYEKPGDSQIHAFYSDLRTRVLTGSHPEMVEIKIREVDLKWDKQEKQIYSTFSLILVFQRPSGTLLLDLNPNMDK